ncbi:MAG: efflux RND transporter periplasmic adaptor subunit [Caulobacteraceae bacterium]
MNRPESKPSLMRPGALILALALGMTPSASSAATVVALTPAQAAALGVRTSAASIASSTPIAVLPGEFVRPPSGRSAVSAPFAGVVVVVSVVEGQAVRAGQTLATVFSRSALDESAGMQQSRAEAALAAATATRTRQLAQEGIVAGARAAEADARAQAARAMLDARSMSINAAGVGAGGRYALRAPFAGVLAAVQVSAGQGVEAMSTAFVVDRQDRIQVQATLPAALAGKVAPGARAVVDGAEGKVVAIGAAIDPKTRSLSVRAEVPPRPAFIPGRAARLELFDGARLGALSVQRSAVTTLGGDSVVFVRTAKGFSATKVAVQGWSGDRAILSGALKAGDAVAVSGVSELKAKAQAE